MHFLCQNTPYKKSNSVNKSDERGGQAISSTTTDPSSEKMNIRPLSHGDFCLVSRIAIQWKTGVHFHIQRNVFQKVIKFIEHSNCSKMREIHLHSSKLVENGVQLKHHTQPITPNHIYSF